MENYFNSFVFSFMHNDGTTFPLQVVKAKDLLEAIRLYFKDKEEGYFKDYVILSLTRCLYKEGKDASETDWVMTFRTHPSNPRLRGDHSYRITQCNCYYDE